MNRRVLVPTPISLLIRQMGLSREMVVRLLTDMHFRLPREYLSYQRFRVADHEDNQCRHRFTVYDEGTRHLFVFRLDDTTSPDHLILLDIQHCVQ